MNLSVARLAVRRARLLTDSNRSRHAPSFERPVSQIATARQMKSLRYRRWAALMDEPTTTLNRKVWEWAYTLEALEQANLLRSGVRALGFGCGMEPIPAILASCGVDVVATDQPSDHAGEWARTDQHAESIAAFSRPSIIADSALREHVSFVAADMRDITDTLRDFDVVWSSCAFEHLGSIQAGLDFVLESVDCLRPGGMAVHTTEFDVDDHDEAVDLGAVVLYRRRDIEALALELRHRGHDVKCNFNLPSEPEDIHIDEPPYSDTHIRVRVGPAASTSFGLTVRRGPSRRRPWPF